MFPWAGRKKRRTREHVLEELSFNHLERHVLGRQYQLARPEKREYGHDATMFYYSESGEKEHGEVRFQLKGTDRLQVLQGGTSVSLEVETAHLYDWYHEVYPFVVVVYDAQNDVAYWLHVQPYVERNLHLFEDPQQRTARIRVPVRNEIDADAIDAFRQLGLEAVQYYLKLLRKRDPH